MYKTVINDEIITGMPLPHGKDRRSFGVVKSFDPSVKHNYKIYNTADHALKKSFYNKLPLTREWNSKTISEKQKYINSPKGVEAYYDKIFNRRNRGEGLTRFVTKDPNIKIMDKEYGKIFHRKYKPKKLFDIKKQQEETLTPKRKKIKTGILFNAKLKGLDELLKSNVPFKTKKGEICSKGEVTKRLNVILKGYFKKGNIEDVKKILGSDYNGLMTAIHDFHDKEIMKKAEREDEEKIRKEFEEKKHEEEKHEEEKHEEEKHDPDLPSE